MSYSVHTPCYGCKHEPICVDGKKIQEAAEAIHNTDYRPNQNEGATGDEVGHYGGGSIVLACVYRDEAVPEPEVSEDQPG
jgi:hypothetical protein